MWEFYYKISVYFDVEGFACDRWEQKKRVIEERMRQDRFRDTLLTTTEEPGHVHCLVCGAKMRVTEKELYEDVAGKEGVLFFYSCPNQCKARRAFFADGEELRPKTAPCPICKGMMTRSVAREDGHVVVRERCVQCGHVETEHFHSPEEPAKTDPDFPKDRERYCFTDERGEEFLKEKQGWDFDVRRFKEQEAENERKMQAERLSKIQRLTVREVEQMLSPVLAEKQFVRLDFSPPQIGRFFIVPFTIQDARSDRPEQQAISEIEVILENLLAATNWRLMSDGVCIQLGILTGRLRGYDKNYELIQLTEKGSKEK